MTKQGMKVVGRAPRSMRQKMNHKKEGAHHLKRRVDADGKLWVKHATKGWKCLGMAPRKGGP